MEIASAIQLAHIKIEENNVSSNATPMTTTPGKYSQDNDENVEGELTTNVIRIPSS